MEMAQLKEERISKITWNEGILASFFKRARLADGEAIGSN